MAVVAALFDKIISRNEESFDAGCNLDLTTCSVCSRSLRSRNEEIFDAGRLSALLKNIIEARAQEAFDDYSWLDLAAGPFACCC